MKRQYEEMELELISFQQEDVITTSGGITYSTMSCYSDDSWYTIKNDT